MGLRRFTLLAFVAFLSSAGTSGATESCNQVEVAPGSEASVSVLLPDTAQSPQPRLTARNATESKPVDAWGPCPTADPYGPCASTGLATVTARKVFDPGDGMQLIGFRMKNAAGAPARTVRLCVHYE